MNQFDSEKFDAADIDEQFREEGLPLPEALAPEAFNPTLDKALQRFELPEHARHYNGDRIFILSQDPDSVSQLITDLKASSFLDFAHIRIRQQNKQELEWVTLEKMSIQVLIYVLDADDAGNITTQDSELISQIQNHRGALAEARIFYLLPSTLNRQANSQLQQQLNLQIEKIEKQELGLVNLVSAACNSEEIAAKISDSLLHVGPDNKHRHSTRYRRGRRPGTSKAEWKKQRKEREERRSRLLGRVRSIRRHHYD